MTAKDAALALIKRWEGCRLSAYPDPATGGAPWTIGYGQTQGVRKGDVWTQEQADSDLEREVDILISKIRKHFGSRKITAGQFGALTSLVYNIGWGAFRRSTLSKRFSEGADSAASKEFDRWNRAGGKVMAGLTNRRADERRVFDGGAIKR